MIDEDIVDNDLDDEMGGGNRSTPIDESGGADESGWLTSYADLMTLVACFFILMMAFASFDPASFQRKAELMSIYFQGTVDVEDNEMQKLAAELKTISNLEEIIDIKTNDEGLEIVMNIKTLFHIGSSILTNESALMIDQVIAKIYETNKEVNVIVEGHTDDIPITGSRLYPSNWELSSSRATSVIRRFETKGFQRDSLIAVGYSDTRPAYPNRDAEGNAIKDNQRKNRRIVLKVMYRPQDSQPMGLGLIYQGQKNGDTSPPKIKK